MCRECGQPLRRTGKPGRPTLFCSVACRDASKRKMLASYPRVGALVEQGFQIRPRQCEMCGVTWSNLPGQRNGRLKYCSPSCGLAHRKGYANPKLPQPCLGCGAPRPARAFQLNGQQKLCADCVPSRRNAVSIRIRKQVWNRDRNICQLCDELVDPSDRSWGVSGPRYPTVDHIVPRSLGGSDDVTNLRTAHAICNTLRARGRVNEQLSWAV